MKVITFPLAFVVGSVGYTLESLIRENQKTEIPAWRPKSTSDERLERRLKEDKDKDLTQIDRLKDKAFIPESIFLL